MKRVIRQGVFETNSSSTHSITICSKEDYDLWEKGEILFKKYSKDQFITKEEAIKVLENSKWYKDLDYNDEEAVEDALREEDIYTFNSYWNERELETFETSFTTKGGEEVIAFGMYGYDG